MKRRLFIGSSVSGMIAAGAVAASPGKAMRMHGRPDSVSGPSDAGHDELVLSIDRMKLGLPTASVGLLASYAHVWSNVLADEQHRAAFFNDPEGFLVHKGIPQEIAQHAQSDIQLLKACCSPRILAAAQSGDARTLLAELRSLGVGQLNRDGIMSVVRTRILENQEAYRTMFLGLADKLKNQNGHGLDDEQLLATLIGSEDVSALLGSKLVGVVGAAVAVVILATVLLYVSVGIAVSVELLAAVQISLLFDVAISVSSSGQAEMIAAEHGAVMSRLRSYGSVYDEFKRAGRIAAIAGQPDATLEMVKEFVATEIESVLQVAEELELLTIAPDVRAQVVGHAVRSSYRALGIEKSV